jgi:addiction module HigA family antidote
MAKQNLIPPSAILKKLMEDYGLSPSKLSAAIDINQGTLRLILLGKSKISYLIALKLAKLFGKTPEYWLNLQNQHDLAEAAKDKELTAVLKSIKPATKVPPAKKAAAKKDDPKAKKSGKPAADSRKTAKAPAGKAPAAKKSAADSGKTAKAPAGKAPAAKKSAADSKRTVKAADKAPAVKKSAVKKPAAANKKAAEPKPAGARRGRKPKSEIAPAAPEPDPAFDPESVFTPEYGAGYDSSSGFGYQEETPVVNQDPEDDSGFSLPDTDESWKS